MSSRKFLLVISGVNQKGINAALSEALELEESSVLSIHQSVLAEQLVLSMLISSEGHESLATMQETLSGSIRNFDLALSLTELSGTNAGTQSTAQPKHFIVTTFIEKLSAKEFGAISRSLLSLNADIRATNVLSDHTSHDSATKLQCIEFRVEALVSSEREFCQAVHQTFTRLGIDAGVQVDHVYRRLTRLAVFDMDSTLIDQEVIDELAKAAGPEVGREVARITAAAMNGELSFEESLKRRVAALEGLSVEVFDEVATSLTLKPGVEALARALKRTGHQLAVVSGGFTYFANFIGQRLGFDYCVANELEILNGQLTGNVVGDIVDAERKAQVLRDLVNKNGLNKSQVIAIGDGANDIQMLSEAGIGIAFHAKHALKGEAAASISTQSMDSALYMLGYSAADIETLARE